MDINTRYLQGIGDLLQAIDPTGDDYLSVLTLQGRLARAIAETRQYGPTDSTRVEIARVTTELDRLCLIHLKQSLQNLCGIDQVSETSLPNKIYQNLPQPDYGRFIGREEELTKTHNLLLPQNRHFLITIDGIGGIGKSSLALEVAHRYLENDAKLSETEGFGAIIWASAKQDILTTEGIIHRGQILRTLDDIYTAISITLEREDITRARSEEQAELVRRALTKQRTLLIVDNLETVDDEAVLTFLRELPAPTKAIVTTRHRIDIAYPVRLEAMPWEDAQQLIMQESERKGVELTNSQARKLHRRTGGVPLALVWSIAQIGVGYDVDSVLTRLGNPNTDIARFCFEGAVEYIRGNYAHKLMMALALFATDASREALGYVVGLDKDLLSRDEGLVLLEKLSLVNKHNGRFMFSPLTHQYALAELDTQTVFKQEAGRRWLDYLKELCHASGTAYYWQWPNFAFIQEGPNILKAIEWAYVYGTANDVFTLILAAYEYLDAVGRWNEALVYVQRALDLAHSVQDFTAIAQLSQVIAWLLRQRGDYQKAIKLFTESLHYYRKTNDLGGECILLQHLSAVFRKQKRFKEAQQFCDKARDIATKLGSDDFKTLITAEYGKLARDMGNWSLAWECFSVVSDQFQELTRETPYDEPLARSMWGHLGIVAYYLGRPHQAKELCLRSLEFFENKGTKAFLATLHYRLSIIEEGLGEYKEAKQHAKLAVDWFERLGMKPDLTEAEDILRRLQTMNLDFTSEFNEEKQ